MDKYKRKQFTIFSIFLLIVVVVVGGIWLLVKPPKATCYDGIQNQREARTDCGGPCGPCDEPKDLIILSQEFIPTTEGNFDFVVKVKNPNTDWGVDFLGYKFYIYDQNGEQIGFKEGETYVLPQETKYIIEQKINLLKLGSIDFKTSAPEWQKIKDFGEIDLRVRNSNYEIIEDGTSKLYGNIENKSNYDLDKVEVAGALFNDGKIIAVGKTEMNTVLMGETRYFEITWPYQISEEVTSFELKAYTNIFLNENFLKTHATPERFKEY